MSKLRLLEDPRLPTLIAAVLGLVAGLAAKQAISLQAGIVPKPLEVLADIMVLGVILIIVMTAHHLRPGMSVEAVALVSAVLAMWGPKGVGVLAARIRKGMMGSFEAMGKAIIEPIEPVHRPTMVDTGGVVLNPHDPNFGKPTAYPQGEELAASIVPIAKLRDVLPLEPHIPVDQAEVIARLDQVTADKDEDGNDKRK